MWILTEVANWFDKQRHENEKFLANAMDHASYDFLGAIVYTGAGVARVLNFLPGAVAAGFLDVLRLGDGVKEGGWGYGKDLLRVLVVAGPALRLARYGLVLVAAVDEAPTVGNCLWVSSAQALRMTGTRHFARVADLAALEGIAAADTGAASTTRMLPLLASVGADAKSVGTVYSFEEVANIARANPNGVVIFGVRFARSAQSAGGYSYLGDTGHALIARSVAGRVLLLDRSGRVFTSLDEVAKLYGASPELGMTIFSDEAALLVNNARIVGLANAVANASWMANSIALEVRSVPGPAWSGSIVLKTDAQLLAGWWWVWVDQYFWCYCFDPNGNVHWSDPYNHRSGSGKWKAAQGAVDIAWSSSAAKEQWGLPIMTGQQTGTYVSGGKTSPLKAVKIQADATGIVGKWQVGDAKAGYWTWEYNFQPYGTVTWRDQFNGKSGSGRWSFTKTSIYINWAPSTTREEWPLPINPQGQGGNSIGASRFEVRANRVS